MREVDRPVMRPMHCAVLPYVGQSNRGTRWVDTGSDLPGGFDNRVYLSDAAIRQAMTALGWPPPERHRELRADVDRLARENAALAAELARARRELEAVHVLRQAGYESSRKPGRPKVQA